MNCDSCRTKLKDARIVVHHPRGISGTFCSRECFDYALKSRAPEMIDLHLRFADYESVREWERRQSELGMPGPKRPLADLDREDLFTVPSHSGRALVRSSYPGEGGR